MLDSKKLARMIGVAIAAATKRLGLSQAKLAQDHFDISPQALNGWKTTGQIDVRHFIELVRLSAQGIEPFTGEPVRRYRPQLSGIAETPADYERHELHPVIAHLQQLIVDNLLTDDQVDRLLKAAQESAQSTASARSLALGKSTSNNRKRA